MFLVLVVILSFIDNGCFIWNSIRVRMWGIFGLVWVILVLAETQRAPLDLAEAERELVSGYNVEYGRFNFVLLFLAEYGNILMLAIFSYLFWGAGLLLWLIVFLFFRSCYPRVRYDWLMSIMWFIMLPFRAVL